MPRSEGAGKSVFIVDDHPVVRAGLALSLRTLGGIEICGEASTIRETIRLLPGCGPELLICDMELGPECGLDLIAESRQRFPDLPILALSAHPYGLFGTRAIKAGAAAFVGKAAEPAVLAAAVHRILASDVRQHPGEEDGGGSHPLDLLSNRELHIWRLLGSGSTGREIADALCVSVKTVDTHLANIRLKLHVGNAQELQFLAFRWAETGVLNG